MKVVWVVSKNKWAVASGKGYYPDTLSDSKEVVQERLLIKQAQDYHEKALKAWEKIRANKLAKQNESGKNETKQNETGKVTQIIEKAVGKVSGDVDLVGQEKKEMADKTKLTRREFLVLGGQTAALAFLASCAPAVGRQLVAVRDLVRVDRDPVGLD